MSVSAAIWFLTALASAVAIGSTFMHVRGAKDRGDVITRLVERTRQFGKIERYVSLLLAGAVFVAFLGSSLNTNLWPTSALAWIALLAQSMFVRPYLTNYADLIERGFARPIERILVVYMLLDVVMIVTLVRMITSGTA